MFKEIQVHSDLKLIFDVFPIGIHRLNWNSAVGKTYVYKLLKSVASRNDKACLCLTYDQHLRVEDYVRLIEKTESELIYLDRYDCYVCDEINSVLEEKAKVIPIFIDLKNSSLFKGSTVSTFIQRSVREVKVYARKNGLRR